jgi:hypothetical protein
MAAEAEAITVVVAASTEEVAAVAVAPSPGSGRTRPSSSVNAIVLIVKSKTGRRRYGSYGPCTTICTTTAIPYESGLDQQKVQNSFLAIQDAWQKKNLKDVNARQLLMVCTSAILPSLALMNKLSQVNKLSNMRIRGIRVARTAVDGNCTKRQM